MKKIPKFSKKSFRFTVKVHENFGILIISANSQQQFFQLFQKKEHNISGDFGRFPLLNVLCSVTFGL
jgi:hypothetical protein